MKLSRNRTGRQTPDVGICSRVILSPMWSVPR